MTQKIDQRIEKHKATLHRTNHLTEEQLDYLKQSKDEQEKAIARIYYAHPKAKIGPTVIHQMLFPNFPNQRGDWPITSTRRAIRNLTQAGILEKTTETSDSLLDGVEHLWRWRKPRQQPQRTGQKKAPPTHRELLERYAGKQLNFHEDLFNSVKPN